MALGALGVVFGDIGTSPLYAIQTVFTADHGRVHTNPVEVYGVISLVFWAITVIVSVKYVGFILRADNDGEGGIMALTALLQKVSLKTKRGEVGAGHARRVRRLAVLRRRHHHAGDLGAVGGRGGQGRRARPGPTTSCRSPSP